MKEGHDFTESDYSQKEDNQREVMNDFLREQRRDEEGLYLEIRGIETFAAFVALVRGANLDDAKLTDIIHRMRKSTQELAAAEKADSKATVANT